MIEQAKHGRVTAAAIGRGMGARLRLRRIALLALLVMIAGLAPATAAELPPHSPEADGATGSDATRCPDPHPDGAPCGPGCACPCCPGHAPSPALSAVRCLAPAPPSSELQPVPIGELRSTNLRDRIFHPPRT